jgi:hypothetical protein
VWQELSVEIQTKLSANASFMHCSVVFKQQGWQRFNNAGDQQGLFTEKMAKQREGKGMG